MGWPSLKGSSHGRRAREARCTVRRLSPLPCPDESGRSPPWPTPSHPSQVFPFLCRSTALVSDIIAPLHFANDPMQQARSNHFVLAKLRRDVLKHGVAGGLRYGFGGLHQPVEFVSGQSQSQLVQWGHGKRSTKNKNAATGLWFSDCISPFRRVHRPDSGGRLVQFCVTAPSPTLTVGRRCRRVRANPPSPVPEPKYRSVVELRCSFTWRKIMSMNQDPFSGTGKNFSGQVEEGFGRVTGDVKTEVEGKRC